MTSIPFAQCWIDAARFELDRRRQTYPRLIVDRKIEEDWAQVDFQCWSTIVEWLETGKARLMGGWAGFAEPPQTIMTWALLEAHAEAGLRSIEAKIERETAKAGQLEGEALAKLQAAIEATRARREAVWCIHHVLAQQRQLADTTARLVDEAREKIRAEKAGELAA